MIDLLKFLFECEEPEIDLEAEKRAERIREMKFREQRRQIEKALIAVRNLRLKDGTAEVIFQDKDTVLKIGDEIFISKCDKEDKFDPEKGLMMCMLKALGFTTTEFYNLFNHSKHFKNSKKSKKDIKCDKIRKKK